MQIFVLNKNPYISAFLLFCLDFKRANKQILELGQIISTVAQNKYKIKDKNLYKSCFINHPIVLWVEKNDKNFIWSLKYLKELANTFYKIKNKHHKVEKIYDIIINKKQLKNIINKKIDYNNIKFCRCFTKRKYKKLTVFQAYRIYIYEKQLGSIK